MGFGSQRLTITFEVARYIMMLCWSANGDDEDRLRLRYLASSKVVATEDRGPRSGGVEPRSMQRDEKESWISNLSVRVCVL